MGMFDVTLAADIGFLVKQGFNAVSTIAVLAVVALGLYIVFAMLRVINIAHGEFLMLGAYTSWVLSDNGVTPWLGIPAAAIVVGVFALLLERLLIRRLYLRGDLSTLLATFGLSIILQRGVGIWLGTERRFVDVPISGNVEFLGNSYGYYELLVPLLAAVIVTAVVALLLWTDFGTRVRATIQNPEMAEAMGINTDLMNMATFALGGALAGMAGAIVAPEVALSPVMGLEFVVRAFLVVIVAGTGNIFAALGGAALIGGWESGVTSGWDATTAQITVLILVIVLALLRPKGIFTRSQKS
jgi:urea transport system permease protein